MLNSCQTEMLQGRRSEPFGHDGATRSKNSTEPTRASRAKQAFPPTPRSPPRFVQSQGRCWKNDLNSEPCVCSGRHWKDRSFGGLRSTVQLNVLFGASGDGRVARPFSFAPTDPSMRLSRTRLFPRVVRVIQREPPACGKYAHAEEETVRATG